MLKWERSKHTENLQRHTHTHTSTDTYPHTQSQSGTHFKDKLNEDFMAAGITSLSEKKKKKSLLFSFSFSRPHWCHLDSLRSVRVPVCARFVLWGIVLIVLCLTALIWAGMQPVTRDTPHHTQTHQHCKHRDNVHGSPMGEEGEGGEGYPLARLNPNASNLFSVALRYLHLTSVPLSCQTQL